MGEIDKVLDELSKLDFSKYAEKEVKNILNNMGKVVAIKTTLHPGKVILRARPNYNGERFSRINEISYKPSKLNKTYQRASTPSNTMFYGTTISETLKEGELKLGRIIGLFEAIPMMRNLESSGEQVITYSKWMVTKDIELISVIHHKDFKRENSYAIEQREHFEEVLLGQSKDLADNSRSVSNFMAEQFAKAITPKDYDYLISAIYTEIAVNRGFAQGVMYPSVRTGGEGFNVAIHPYYVHNHMTPTFVGECTIYKRKEHTIIDNETGIALWDGYSDFELKPVLPEYHEGKDNILRVLYPEKYK